jgi:hypothetical protein
MHSVTAHRKESKPGSRKAKGSATAHVQQGFFRVRISGDSMAPKYPDDCVAELKLL